MRGWRSWGWREGLGMGGLREPRREGRCLLNEQQICRVNVRSGSHLARCVASEAQRERITVTVLRFHWEPGRGVFRDPQVGLRGDQNQAPSPLKG